MSRKLASVQRIKAIKPIEGADRIEIVQVLNWDCVASKGQYKIGDMVIYFEIDSLLPDIPTFEFLKGSSWSQKLNKYKIRTQKFRGQISQGLVIPVSQLKEIYQQINPKEDYYPMNYTEGADLTELLRIEKYEPPVSNGPLGDIIQHEWYVPKTDECFAGKTLIDTEQGKLPISKIVNEKLKVNVKSWNETENKIEYKPVIGYFKKENNTDTLMITSVTSLGRRTNNIICTTNHPFYTAEGIKCAKDLTLSDVFYRNDIKLSNLNKEVLLGTLLGDSCFHNDKTEGSNYSVSCSQGEKQLSYLLYKQKLLSNILHSTNINKSISGYNTSNNVHSFHTKAFTELTNFIEKFCLKNNKKYITELWANNLTPLSLAIWYMDDGTISIGKGSIYIRIATNAYSLEEQNNLINALYYNYNIHANVHLDKRSNTYFLSMRTHDAYNFCKLIAPYVINDMNYKLPKDLQILNKKEIVNDLKNISYGLVESKITRIQATSCKTVYNIQVKDNENYFANGVLTHNCRIQTCAENVLPEYMKSEQGDWYASVKLDGTSCTAGLFEDGFLIGGRNQWYKDENMYTTTVKKYITEEKLKAYQEATGMYVVFQGELCGPGIQCNRLGLKEKDWFIFNVFTSDTGKMDSYTKCDLLNMLNICEYFGLKTVPLIPAEAKFNFKVEDNIDKTVEDLLSYVDGIKYRTFFEDASPNQIAEGLVFRFNDMTNSFKVISNKFLLKGGE